MSEEDKIIEQLSALDLSKYPEKEVKQLLSGISRVGAVKTTLHAGKVIIRARPNYNNETFSKISQISYKPAEFNTTYQRASTPNNTMFYGSHISEHAKPGELDMVRIIGLFEAVPLMKDLNSSGEQVITYSKWVVKKDIELISIISHQDFKRENSYAKEQREYFEKFISSLPKDIAHNTKLVSNFISKEFAKDITPVDYHYLISGIYTELVINKPPIAGVMYPSVRMGGEGFNVGIHPYYVHNYMEPIFVGECTIYKHKENTIIDNNTGAILLDSSSDFELKPVLPEFHTGRQTILKTLYPET